jgi:hypothetical protein
MKISHCGTLAGQAVEQREIDALVDHAEEAESRMRHVGPWIEPTRGRARNAPTPRAWQAHHVAMTIRSRPIQAASAREHEIRALEQGSLALLQLPRCVAQCAQFIHAVIDDRVRVHVCDERQRHRRVQPGDRADQRGQGRVQQLAQDRHLVVVETGRREGSLRLQHLHVYGGLPRTKSRRAVDAHRLLDEQHVVIASEARDDLLGTLIDEVVTQVREHHYRRIVGDAFHTLFFLRSRTRGASAGGVNRAAGRAAGRASRRRAPPRRRGFPPSGAAK